MGQGTLICVVFVTVTSAWIISSAQYVQSQRSRAFESGTMLDPNSYLPDPPVIGLRPPLNGYSSPRIDRHPPTRRYPKPNHTRSRYRNNFGKGKRMRRPPGPFKVIGKRKTCSYRRKMIQQPRRRQSDPGPYLRNKERRRNGRAHPKPNLLARHFAETKPMQYYRNLPSQGYPSTTATPLTPPRHHSNRFYGPIQTEVGGGLDLNKYRVFIHQYSYGSEESEASLKQRHYGYSGRSPIKRTSFGTRSPPDRPQMGGNSHLLNHKSNLLPPSSQPSAPSNPKGHILSAGGPGDGFSGKPSTKEIVRSHLYNFDNDHIEQKRLHSSVVRPKDDNGQRMTAIKPPPLTHGKVELSTVFQSTNSSPSKHFHAPSQGLNGTELEQKTTTKTPAIDVIYVTPQPYVGEWSAATSATDGVVWTNMEAATDNFLNVRIIGSDSEAARTKVMSSGGHLVNDHWRPIYPDSEDINRWFKTVTVAPNRHWVELQKR